MKVSIITPSYNRGKLLKNIYNSLLKQTNKNFEWIIVDDGSTDNTNEIVQNFINENKIDIKYKYKDNGGKHTALNLGYDLAIGEYTLILDSDDYLMNNAIEIIIKYWNKYDSNKDIAVVSFLRKSIKTNENYSSFDGNEIITTSNEFRINKGVKGDMAETFRTDILRKNRFPVFYNERFLSEAWLFRKLSQKYKFVYTNIPVVMADYLENGLSDNSLKLRANNPYGAMVNANLTMTKDFKLKIRFKNAILFDGFKIAAKKKYGKFTFNNKYKLLSIIFYPAGLLFYLLLLKNKVGDKK